MKRVVLDTCVIVSAFRSQFGASYEIMQRVANGHIRPLVTTALFLEYESVLLRPEQMAVHNLDFSDIREALFDLATFCEPVELFYRWRPQLGDPQDELVLDAAINGRADALITHNVRDFMKAGDKFGLTVIRPGNFLKGTMQ